MIRKITLIVICLIGAIANSQITITGNVFDEYLEPFSGAIINSEYGNTTSNFDGEFTLNVTSLPVTLKISSVGYSNELVVINNESQTINVILKETYGLDQVVISASRTPERIMESPVTIERIGEKQIKNTASHNFYESIRNLKGIDVLDNNHSTKIVVSNRGFAALDNIRFVQLVDGVDTVVPAFEYSIGNVFGLNELDVKNIEILPGASSALYGANAFNGILLMTSKNPFEHEGLSVYAKAGVSSEKERGNAGFYDTGFRYAIKFNDKFAAKLNVTYQNSEDWLANDLSNINGGGFDHSNGNTNYNGVNVYGDDFSLNLVDLALLASGTELFTNSASPLFGQNPLALLSLTENAENARISRTGFQEQSFVDYGLNNILFDFALHFRPNTATELILATKHSQGDNVTQSVNRYFQENSSMQHYRFELKNDNYFVRAYYNENDSGETYDSKLAGNFITQAWKDNTTFYSEYAQNYFISLASGLSNEQAHDNARTAVNIGTPDDISSLLELAKNTDIAEGGSRLFEKSGFYNVDANWNLSELINFQNLQVGGNFKSFALDSNGQVYTDYDGTLRYRQFGFYTQLQRKFANDRLKFSGTLRFDKSKNFDGKFTPRATLSYAAGEKKDHNFRIGFQTGFRNPTSRDQYAGLNIGSFVLLGSVDDNLDRYSEEFSLVTDPDTFASLTGRDAFENSFTAASVDAYQTDFRSKLITAQSLNVLPDPSLLEVTNFDKIIPETVRSFELGYRGAVDLNGGLFEFDVVGYYNIHEDYITETEVVVPLYGEANDLTSLATTAIAWNDFQRFQITTNAKSNINAFGFSAGFNTKLFDKLNLAGSYAFSDFNVDEVENDVVFKPSFNTPKHAIKLQLNTGNLFNNFGFGIDTRWQDAFLFQTRFVDQIIEERITLDAQVNYTIPSIKSVIKLGVVNLTGKEYVSVQEAGLVGSQYYLSWVINN